MKNNYRCLILFLIALFFPFQIFAYDNLTTHPALTQEIVKFYNQFYQPKINDQEKQWLMTGSKEEDDPVVRTLNHFYDPVYHRGLSGDINADVMTPFLTVLKPFIQSAKDWAKNSYAQATFLGEAYRNAALNPFAQITKSAVDVLTVHTWEKSIYNYIIGNKKEAFEDLGHILHLLEDMAVPAHTRNDHHLTGDKYEQWASQFSPQNIDVVSALSGKNPIILNSLDAYFDYLASYTNSHFYSQDTIGIQSGYQQPQWDYLETKAIDGFIYSIKSDDFGNYLLAKRKDGGSLIFTTKFDIDINDNLIRADYWSHLSKKAVLTGAGVLNLFFREVEKYKNDSSFLSRMRKTIIATTIENIKKSLGLAKEEENQNQATENSSLVSSSISNSENQIENSKPIEITPIVSPIIEINQTVFTSPTPSPTYQPTFTPKPSFSPLPTPSPSPLITPFPTLTPNPSSTPIANFASSGNSSSSTPTPTTTPTLSPTSKILISEIFYDAEGSDEGKEFIELYNPNEIDLNLIGWSLRLIKNNSTTSESLVSINKNDSSIIKSHSFLLIGFNKYNASNFNNTEADIIRASNALPNPKEGENVRIILLDNKQNIIDEIIYQKNSCPEGKSLERKANASSTADSMINGDDRFLGNGYDSDSMDDFIIRDPQPQNSKNLPEPRNKPTPPAAFAGQESIVFYDASSTSLIFRWMPSIDANGSSDGILYKIFQKKDNEFVELVSTTSTQFVMPISEFNNSSFFNPSELQFKIIAYDRDGLASDEASFNLGGKEGIIFAQLGSSNSSAYSHYSDNWYRLGRGFSGKLKSITLKACRQYRGTATITLKEFEDENYTHEISSKTILEDDSSLPILVESPPDACPKEIKISNLNIELHPYSYYRLDTYHSWQNMNVILWGTNATGTAMYNTWEFNKGRVEYYYTFYPYIILEGEIGPKIDFSIPQKPTPPEIKDVQFNNLAETITFSWASSTDLDSLDEKITYEYNVTDKDGFDENNWQSAGFNLSATAPVSYPSKYKIAVRAVDDTGLKSEISQITWEFPNDFVIIQQQRRMDQITFNANPYINAQVFIPTQSAYVKGLKISVQSFVGEGYNRWLQAFLYDADDPRNVSEEKLIDYSRISEIAWGNNMQHIEMIFPFEKGVFLEAGHKYVWLITANHMTVSLDGISGESLVGGEAWARYGYNDWYSNEGWLAPSNYYFVLIGSNHPERNF